MKDHQPTAARWASPDTGKLVHLRIWAQTKEDGRLALAEARQFIIYHGWKIREPPVIYDDGEPSSVVQHPDDRACASQADYGRKWAAYFVE